jgi:hypothetical protein
LSSFEFSIYCPVFQYGKFHQITRCETTKKMKLSTLVQLDSNAEKIWNHKPYPKSTKQGRHWFCRFCHWIKLDIYCSYMCVYMQLYVYKYSIDTIPKQSGYQKRTFPHDGAKNNLGYPSFRAQTHIILSINCNCNHSTCMYIYIYIYFVMHHYI